MKNAPLRFDAGRHALATGKDLASVVQSLNGQDLDYYIDLMRRNGSLPFELSILESEADRRGSDWGAGPLWR